MKIYIDSEKIKNIDNEKSIQVLDVKNANLLLNVATSSLDISGLKDNNAALLLDLANSKLEISSLNDQIAMLLKEIALLKTSK